ncbi:hypothetical protein QOT17_021458 [Balamuthia mandrillaris]
MEGATTLASSPRLTMTSPATFCFSSPPATVSSFSTLWPCNNNQSMTFSVGQVRPREEDCDKGFCFTPSPSLFNTSSHASSSSSSSTFCFSLNNDPHCITSSPKGPSSFHTPSVSPSATSNPFPAASSSFCDNTQNFGGSGCWPSSTTSFGSYSTTSFSNSNNNTLMDVMSPTKKPRPSGWGLSQKARHQREEEEEEEEEEAGPSSTRNHPSSFPSLLTPFSSRKRGFMVEELQQQKTGGEEDNSRPGSSLFPNNASNNMQEELQQEGKAHVRRKLIHKKPDAKDIPKARLVEVRFGSEEETVPAKILYKEPWGVQVMLLESKEHLGGGGAIKGKRYWAKFSGANTPVANIPILEAMHEC